MNKEIEITELMREYTDDEFNIEGENAADTEKVVESVMAQVKPKRKIKPLFKVLIAAVAAVVLAGAVTAGTLVLSGSFTSALGREVDFSVSDDKRSVSLVGSLDVSREQAIKKEDGRLYFTVGDQHTDITDLIDRQTPYIYSYTNAESGTDVYVIAGGTPDEYGFVELYYMESIGWYGLGWANELVDSNISVMLFYPLPSQQKYEHVQGYANFYVNYIIYDDINGNRMLDKNENEVYHDHSFLDQMPETWREDCHEAWLFSALEQLGAVELP